MTPACARILAASCAALGGVAAASSGALPTALVWNASASAPVGLYRIEPQQPGVGDYALVAPSGAIARLVEERAYLPPSTPLIKRIAARAPSRVCRRGAIITIDAAAVAVALNEDSAGRAMPRWEGCVTLGRNEVFLLNDHPLSLDGRYGGVTRRTDILGAARPLWIVAADR